MTVPINLSVPSESLKYIKTDKNQLEKGNLKDLVRLSIHSPIQVDVYDKDGNHLGISSSSTSAHTFFDEHMPNSYYLKFGEGTYLGFPLQASTTIKLQGTGGGSFTLEMEQYQGDTLQETQTFTNIPVGTTTKATLVINTLSDAKELALDHNGDGKVDAIALTDENKKTVTIQTLKGEIQTLSSKVQPAFLNQLALVEKLMSKKNYKATIVLFNVMKKEIEVLSRKKIDNRFQIEKEQALRILAVIDTLVENVNKK